MIANELADFANELKKRAVIDSVIIADDNDILYEEYFNGFNENKLHRLFSVTKTLTGMAVGILADNGQIDMDMSVASFFPELLPPSVDDRIMKTTVRDCLRMQSCYTNTTYDKFSTTENWVESFFTSKPQKNAGTLFNYDTGAAHVLCAAVEALTGTDLLSYMRESILNLTDFSKDSYILKDPFGVSMGGSGLCGTSRDLLILTRLLSGKEYLCNDGVRRNLLPSSFVLEATQFQSDTRLSAKLHLLSMGYGEMVWHDCHGGYFLYGMGGQFGFCFPLADGNNLFVITTADTQGNAAGDELIYEAICDRLLPSINLTEGRFLHDRREPEPFLKIVPKHSVYEIKNNDNFKALQFDFDKDNEEFSLKLVSKHAYIPSEDIRFSFKEKKEGKLNYMSTPLLTEALVTLDGHLYLNIRLIGCNTGSIRMEFAFNSGFTRFEAAFKKIEETYYSQFNGIIDGELCN